MSRQAMAKRDDEKTRRLAAALRENLKRRKAQARAAGESEGEAGDEPKR
jgi:hypothetical protein